MSPNTNRATVPLTVDEMPDRELYAFLRDRGYTPEQADLSVRTRNEKMGGGPKPAPAAPAPDEPLLGVDAARTAAQGASFGFSDEIIGGLRGMGNKAPLYMAAGPGGLLLGALLNRDKTNKAIDEERAGVRAYRDANPKAAIALEMGGALATAPFTGGAGSLRAVVKQGAKLGAAYGAGTAEGGLAERVGGAIKGGFIGAPTAVAGYGLARGAQAALTPVAQRAAGYVAGLAEKAGKTPQEIGQAIARSGKPTVVMDVLGRIGQRAARGARALSPAAGEVIDETLGARMAGQEERILSDALAASGIGGRTNVVQTAQKMIEERAANAKPLYDAARNFEVKDQRVLSVFEHPQFQQAYQRARAIAQLEGETLPDIFTYDKAGKITGLADKPIPVGALDYVKRGLDDVIEGGFSAGGMGKPMARALRTRLDQMLGALDELVPEYKTARAQFAGDSRLMDAFEEGRNLFKVHPDEAAQWLAGKTEGELDLYRKGALEAMAAKIENVPARRDLTLTKPLDESTLDQKRLQLLFGSEGAFNRFKQAIQAEINMARGAQNVTGNSQTVDKLVDLAGMVGLPVEPTLSAARGNFATALTWLGQQGQKAVLSRRSEAVAPLLMAGRKDVPNVLREIRLGRLADEEKRRVAGRLGRGLGAAVAAASLSP